MPLNYQNFAAGVAPLAPVAGGVANIAGSVLGSGAQTSAAGSAINTQNQFYAGAQANAQPYMQAGGAAINQLGSFYGLPGYQQMNSGQLSNMLTSLPGYQFNLNQGVQAIDRSAASKGLLNSGATGQALTQFGQGLGGNYLNQYVQGLQGLAGQGAQSTAQLNQLGAQYANNIGSAQIYQGNAKAGGYLGAANGLGQVLGGLPGALGYGQPGTAGQYPLDYQAQQQYIGANDANVNNYLANGGGQTFDSSDANAIASSGFNPDTFDPSNFNAAGGEAAGQVASDAQSTDNSAVAAYRASAGEGASALQPTGGDSSMPVAPPSPTLGQSLNTFNNALGAASSGLNVYNGLNRGGISGYGGAALSAASLANRAGANIPGVGPAGDVLGIYNGLKQGGVTGYVGAGLDAAKLYGSVGSAAGLPGAAAASSAAIPAALFMAQYGIAQHAMQQTPMDLLNSPLFNAKAGPGSTPAEIQQFNAQQQQMRTDLAANPAYAMSGWDPLIGANPLGEALQGTRLAGTLFKKGSGYGDQTKA